MRKLFILTLPVYALLISGCSTMKKSTLLGAGIGAASGAAVGSMSSTHSSSNKRKQKILLGTAFGAFAGALLGQQSHRYIDKKAKVASPEVPNLGGRSSLRVMSKKPVRLKPAKIKVRFVDDQVFGKTKVPAHFEYDILEEARWE